MSLVKIQPLLKTPYIEDDHMAHLQVDEKILDEIDYEHKTPQPLGEPIPSKLANVVIKY